MEQPIDLVDSGTLKHTRVSVAFINKYNLYTSAIYSNARVQKTFTKAG